jgi:hypothetical protein
MDSASATLRASSKLRNDRQHNNRMKAPPDCAVPLLSVAGRSHQQAVARRRDDLSFTMRAGGL